MITKEKVSRDKGIDNTLNLLKEGYMFIKNRADQYKSDLFETHLLGEKVICMIGEEAAKIFYNPEYFKRHGAAPKRIQKTLFGENAIQTMDGEEHIHRKQHFMSLLTDKHQKQLSEVVMENWEKSLETWEESKEIVLFDEAKIVLCAAACQWAGVQVEESELKDRAEDFSSMVDGFGAVGPRHWKGRKARNRAEDWIQNIIEDLRSGKLEADKNSALHAMASYKDVNGKQMDSKMAAIELINVIRPIVAISTFITFAAFAMYQHPECKNKLLSKNPDYLEMFVQEVRRYYPFGPFVGARVKKDFAWSQFKFSEGMLVLLDMYGTNHDSRIWENPDEFNPERFKKWDGNLFNFIPQGGGEPSKTHRCPGEGVTTEVMKVTLEFLLKKIEFEVPKQDLSYGFVRIPSGIESGFIINNIKRKG